MKTHKEHLLEGLSGIERDLSSRKEKPHEPESEEHHEGQEGAEEHEEKEVDHHLVASGQFDCPHCGGKLKVGHGEHA